MFADLPVEQNITPNCQSSQGAKLEHKKLPQKITAKKLSQKKLQKKCHSSIRIVQSQGAAVDHYAHPRLLLARGCGRHNEWWHKW